MAEPRIVPFIGPKSGNEIICVRISGDTLIKIHRFSSVLTAIEDCVRAATATATAAATAPLSK